LAPYARKYNIILREISMEGDRDVEVIESLITGELDSRKTRHHDVDEAQMSLD
jgi:hypothetical protein